MKKPDLSFEFPEKNLVVEWYCEPPRRRTLYYKPIEYHVIDPSGELVGSGVFKGQRMRVVHVGRGLHTNEWPAIAVACVRYMRTLWSGAVYTSVRSPCLLSHCYEDDAVVGCWNDPAVYYDTPSPACLGSYAAELVRRGEMHPVDAYWFSVGHPHLQYCYPDYYERTDQNLRMTSARLLSSHMSHRKLTF